MAARRKSGGEDRGSSIRFVMRSSLQWIFGAPFKGEFDSERGLVDYALRFINSEESPVEPDPDKASTEPLLQPAVLASMRQDLRATMRKFVAGFKSNRAAALRS